MNTYKWAAIVTAPDRHPATGTGTVRTDTPRTAKILVSAFVRDQTDGGTAEDIQLTVQSDR